MKSVESALEEYVSAGLSKRNATLLVLMDGIDSLSPPDSLAKIIAAYRAAVLGGVDGLWQFVEELDRWRLGHQVGRALLFGPLLGLITPNIDVEDDLSLGELFHFYERHAAYFLDPDLAERASIMARFVPPISLESDCCRIRFDRDGVDVSRALASLLVESLQGSRPWSNQMWAPAVVVSDFWRRYPGGPGAWVRYLQPECRRWRWVCKEDWGDGVSAIVVDASGGDPDFSGLLTALGILGAQDVSVQCADA